MSDLIENMQNVYKKWESRSRPSRGRLKNSNHCRFSSSSENSLSNFSRSLSQRTRRTPRYNTPKYDGLAEFKMAPTVMSFKKPRPFVGIPCAKCFPHSKAGIEDQTVYLLGVHNILHIPYLPLQSLNMCCFWNIFKLNSSFLSSDISSDILKSKRVEDAIQEMLVSDDSEGTSESITIDRLHHNARTTVNSLKSSISSFFVEVTGFCLHNILKKIFNGVFVHKGQMEILKILSKENIPFVYLPLYRSYFDYILISYVLHMNSLKVPFFIIPDELYISFLGYILKFLGAIFVRKDSIIRNSNTDILYDAIVKSCLEKCLTGGQNIEFFLESQRSKTGKPQTPNTNLLSAVVEFISEGSVEDAYVVPVSIIYETTEGSFVAEQLRSNYKEDKSFFSKFFSLWKIMHFKHGNVRVNFNQPFSVKEFLQSYSTKKSTPKYSCSSSNSFSSELALENCEQTKHRSAACDLAVHAMFDATTCTSLMSTHLLAFLFVTQYRKGGTQQQLQSSMDWLRGEIQRKRCDVGFSGESLPVIKRAVELLGKDLISSETIEMEWTSSDLENNNVKVKIYTPVVKLPHILELQYYANAVLPVFLRESILVNALYAMVDVDICHFHHCDSRFYVSRDGLVQTAIRLSNILKFEFITVPPCQDLVSSFNDTIDELIEKECLSTTNGGDLHLKSKKKSNALSFDISSDEDGSEEVTEQQLRIDLKEESISHFEFLRSILSPYIESYWLAACSLLGLIDEVKEERVFIHEMQMTAQEKLYKGLLGFEESFSAETLQNSLKMFCERNIIEYYCEGSIRTVCLTEPFNSIENVNDIIADIEDFRK